MDLVQRRPPDPRQPCEHERQELSISSHTAWTKTAIWIMRIWRKKQRKHQPKMIVAGASAYSRTIDFERIAKIAREVRRAVYGGYGAHRGACGRWPAPEPRALCRRGDNHHPQNAARPPRRPDPVPGGVRQGHRQGYFPGYPGRPAGAYHRGQGRVLRRSAEAGIQRISEEYRRERPRAGPGAAGRGAGPGVRRHGQPPDDWWTCAARALRARSWSAVWTRCTSQSNKNTVPNDPEKPFVTSGVRIGTPAVTTRGFGPEEMRKIAKWIAACTFDFEAQKEAVAAEVAALTARFPLYE